MFLSTCEIMSTIIGALAGSIASSRVKMDLFGVIVCGTLAALGGGTVRDILLDIPVYWTLPSGEIFVLASVVTSLATFYVAQKYPPPMGTIRVADAIVLALVYELSDYDRWYIECISRRLHLGRVLRGRRHPAAHARVRRAEGERHRWREGGAEA